MSGTGGAKMDKMIQMGRIGSIVPKVAHIVYDVL